MSRINHLLPACILLSLLIAVPAMAQTGLLRGTVLDPDEQPIEGVQVTVTSATLPTYRENLTTDKRGEFKLRFGRSHSSIQFEFLFEKSGYQSFKQAFSPSATRAMRERWTMDVSDTKQVESLGDLSAVVTGSSNIAIEAFNAGLKAQRDGDLATARVKLEEAIAEDDSLGPAQIALAQVLLDQKEYDASVAAADRALELAVSRAAALQVKYQALRAAGKNDEADAVSAELDQAEGSKSAALRIYNEGGAAFQAADRTTALAKFEEAAKLDPSLQEAQHAIASLQLANGNYDASAAAAEQALALGSDNVATLRVLYDAYEALGRTDELTEIAPRLAAVDGEFGGSKLVEQAAAMWNGGETEKAIALANQALAIDPSLAKAYYFIGLDHLSRDEKAEAKAALQKFIDMAPEDSDAATAKEMMTYIQ